MSTERIHRDMKWTPEDRARHKAIREKFQKERPTLRELVESGDVTPPMPFGLYLELRAALAALKARPAPRMSNPDARQYLRAYGRAQEGLGDAPGAVRTYAEFIRFGSQVRTKQDCRGCHHDAGPREMAWFRDWWAGARYAALNARLGQTDRVIAEQEAAVASHPDDTAAYLMLAYLYGAKGEQSKARALWAALSAESISCLAKRRLE